MGCYAMHTPAVDIVIAHRVRGAERALIPALERHRAPQRRRIEPPQTVTTILPNCWLDSR